MQTPTWRPVLRAAAEQAVEFLESLPQRAVGATSDAATLRAALDVDLGDEAEDPADVVQALADAADGGLVATPSGRFFGFVIGGSLPAALAVDWLTAAWDQNAGLYAASPAAAVAEEVAGRWLVDLLGLPDGASVGFTTGGQMANLTCLAAARTWVLEQAGWDVERSGLVGAPPVRVVVGAERHDTVDRALRFLGLGTDCIVAVPADEQGRLRADALGDALAGDAAPTIVCAQAGNVNTGAVDPLEAVCELAGAAGAWVHVDGAFGLWAAASARRRDLLSGAERADSWATDAHKWLNVPYDSGLAFVRDPGAHRRAMSVSAAYLMHAADHAQRDEMDWNPEFSRRARGFPVYAALRSLGRAGVAQLVDRCCDLAARFAERLEAAPGVEVLNEVALNQVLVRFHAADGDHDAWTDEVVRRVQSEGTCWMSPTTWHGARAMRISVSNWSTDEADVDAAVHAVLRCATRA